MSKQTTKHKAIPFPIIRNYIGRPAVVTLDGNPLVAIIRRVGIEPETAKQYYIETETYNPEDVESCLVVKCSDMVGVRPILKTLDDLTPEQILRFFKMYFENPTGISENGGTFTCEVLSVEKTAPHTWTVESRTTVSDDTVEDFEPVVTDDVQSWNIPPGSLEFVPVSAFLYAVDCGVDAYGLINVGLALPQADFKDIVDVGGVSVPVEFMDKLGLKKQPA